MGNGLELTLSEKTKLPGDSIDEERDYQDQGLGLGQGFSMGQIIKVFTSKDPSPGGSSVAIRLARNAE